jgi:hypothetical protein
MNVSELKRKQPALAGIAAAIALALGSGLQAQQPSQQPRPQQQQPQPQPQTQSQQPRTQADQQIARSDSGTQTLDQYLQSKSLRVSKVDGMELQARNGDNLGEVDDVMRGASPSQMMLIVKIGGVGADSKVIAVPFNEVQISAKGDELYTTRTREQLAAAPAVQANAPTAGANRDAQSKQNMEPTASPESRQSPPQSQQRQYPPPVQGGALEQPAINPRDRTGSSFESSGGTSGIGIYG